MEIHGNQGNFDVDQDQYRIRTSKHDENVIVIERKSARTTIRSYLPWHKDEYRAEKILKRVEDKTDQMGPMEFRIIRAVAKMLKIQPEWYLKRERVEALKLFEGGNLPSQKGLDQKFMKDKKFMLEAIRLNVGALFLADPQLKEDPDFMLDAMDIDPRALINASEGLMKNDHNFLIKALERKPEQWTAILMRAHSFVKQTPKFKEAALKLIPDDQKSLAKALFGP